MLEWILVEPSSVCICAELQFLGYRKGANGIPEIVPEEAELVIWIYKMFMSGKSTSAIARQLTNEGIPTPGRKKVWQKVTVDSILTNEKCKGAALLQKKYMLKFMYIGVKTAKEQAEKIYTICKQQNIPCYKMLQSYVTSDFSLDHIPYEEFAATYYTQNK